jgi:hypothetical protein
MNALGSRFGVTYLDDTLSSYAIQTRGRHALINKLSVLKGYDDNGIPFTIDKGDVLAQMNGAAVLGLVEHGDGEVVILADVGFFGTDWDGLDNLPFWENLAEHARSR